MSRIGSDGIRYGTNDVVTYTQPSYSIRYKGTWSSASNARNGRGANTDEPNSSGTGIPPGGQGLVTVAFDYWLTYNKTDRYGNFTGYWDFVYIKPRNVCRQYSDVYGNYTKVIIYHGEEGGAHTYNIKYYTFE